MIFRSRRRSTQPEPSEAETAADAAAEVDHRRQVGPWDVAERPREEGDPHQIDLGGLLVTGRPGIQLQLQTDPESGMVAALVFLSTDGAVEVRAFAASRGQGVWDAVRQEIVGEAARLGGTASEVAGEYGVELRLVVPVRTPDGSSTTQVSRVVGIEGPRWLLRATYLGRPAVAPTPDDVLIAVVRDLVVVRGTGPMAPREPLALRLPVDATMTEPPDGRHEEPGSSPS